MADYKPRVTYEQNKDAGALTYDKKKKQYDVVPATRSGTPLPGQNEYVGPEEPSKAGAGRGGVKKRAPKPQPLFDSSDVDVHENHRMKKGGMVRRGYGKARGC